MLEQEKENQLLSQERKNSFTLYIKAEGGLPVKRFVDGDDVTPSVCQIINDKCTCVTFDFLEIDLK